MYNPDLLEFKESSHRYFYDGESIPSVTTILGIIAKPQLIYWTAKLAADRFAKDLRRHIINNEYLLEDDIEGLRSIAAKVPHTDCKAGARLGTLVHQTIEEYLATKEDKRAPVAALGYMKSFRKWWDDQQETHEGIAIEHRLFHPKWKYAGTADLVMRDRTTGTIKIIDFKTTKRSKHAPYGLYREYLCQAAAYAEGWNTAISTRRDSCTTTGLVNLCPDGGLAIEITRDTFDISQDFMVFRQAHDLGKNLDAMDEIVNPPKKGSKAKQ